LTISKSKCIISFFEIRSSMFYKTVVGDSIYFSSRFVRECGVYLGDPPRNKPYIPLGYRLIADMEFEMDLTSSVGLTQDVSMDEDYSRAYERHINGGLSEFKITVELYLVKKSDIAMCEIEYIDPERKWPWEDK